MVDFDDSKRLGMLLDFCNLKYLLLNVNCPYYTERDNLECAIEDVSEMRDESLGRYCWHIVECQ